jgi:hypothetical protein
MTALVRIAALASAGDDGVGGQAASLDDGGVDDGAELFRSERVTVVEEAAFAVDLADLESLDALGQPDFGHHQGGADFLYFGGALDLALGKEGTVPGLDLDLELAQFSSEAKWKAVRDDRLANSVTAKQQTNDLRQPDFLGAALAQLFLKLA